MDVAAAAGIAWTTGRASAGAHAPAPVDGLRLWSGLLVQEEVRGDQPHHEDREHHPPSAVAVSESDTRVQRVTTLLTPASTPSHLYDAGSVRRVSTGSTRTSPAHRTRGIIIASLAVLTSQGAASQDVDDHT